MFSGVVAAILCLGALAGDNNTQPQSPAPAPSNGSVFHLSGYVQGRFTDTRDTPDRLEVRRVRLLMSGELGRRISYLIQGDVVKLPNLLDAEVEFKVARALKFTAGQFKLPFSLSSLTADNLEVPIERAKAVNALVPARDIGTQGRDSGVQLSGTFGSSRSIEYFAGVFSGELLINSPQPRYHAAAARAVAHVWHGLQIAGDMYRSFSAPAHKEKIRQSAEARYVRGPLTVDAEYLWGRDGNTHRRGGYALAVWHWSKKWEGLVRDDWYTSNTDKANARTQTWLAGANYYPWRKVRIEANGGVRQEPASVRLSGVFLTQLQIGF
ncbi:MAG: OprO/OprP family phosphate-selective porin [Acidobacteriia bacterium]|nr:OprO/OprP family phosphate-selective porin [Terriglobia bacterium]